MRAEAGEPEVVRLAILPLKRNGLRQPPSYATSCGLQSGENGFPRGAMLPIEKNARTLVRVLAQHFPVAGGTSEDLRQAFVKDTSLVAPQSFYAALKHCKQQNWLVGGGRDQPYTLNPDGSWREPMPSIRETLEKEALDKDRLEYLVDTKTQQIGKLEDKVERLLDWGGGDDANGSGVAIPSLIRIITDSASTTRQRLKAAETILSYKVSDASVVEFTKKFLQSICTGADVAIDYRVEAAGLLRRCESPRIAPETVRPVYREAEPTEPPEPLMQLVARRRARQERREREAIERLEREAIPSEQPRLLALLASRSGNGDDESSD